jgi:hypothetical protein
MADCKPAVETGDLSPRGHMCGDAECIVAATALTVRSQSKKISLKFRFLEFRIMPPLPIRLEIPRTAPDPQAAGGERQLRGGRIDGAGVAKVPLALQGSLILAL